MKTLLQTSVTTGASFKSCLVSFVLLARACTGVYEAAGVILACAAATQVVEAATEKLAQTGRVMLLLAKVTEL